MRTDHNPRSDDIASFFAAWPLILSRLRAGNGDEVVKAELGIVAQTHLGMYPSSQNFPSLAAAFGELHSVPRLDDCQLSVGPRPEIDCNTLAFPKLGCVLSEPANPLLAPSYESFMRYVIGPPENAGDERVIAELERRDELARVTVTDTSSSYRFHFGIVEGKWVIIALDFYPKTDLLIEVCPPVLPGASADSP